MKFIADFHIHSHFSIATSKQLIPEYLDYWARIKGIKVVGTGDFTHPGWVDELKDKLEPAEPGLFRLKQALHIQNGIRIPITVEHDVRFMLTAEISNIYKKHGKTRKVHNVIFAPDFTTVEKIQQILNRYKFNITSDGRPILGLDSRDLLEICLEASDQIFFVPAHIWTPWFSALGSKSGFDSIEACYGDLSNHIYAVETGLSSDPPMNWLCSFLDNYSLISNSDAHSPEKLGREGNRFDTDVSYDSIVRALKKQDGNGFKGTLEFFPQEGKYHLDGHRKCGISWEPHETRKHQGLCTVCGKPVTIGVMHRVIELADRESDDFTGKPFESLIPLKEILSELLRLNPSSKQITRTYHALIEKLGSEFYILLDCPLDEIRHSGHELMAEAVRRMRCREVVLQSGYDGEFGVIKVFGEELDSFSSQKNLFEELTGPKNRKAATALVSDEVHQTRARIRAEREPEKIIQAKIFGPNEDQLRAIRHFNGPALVLAGPGTGKTRVLTERIVHLIPEHHISPDQLLAVTFTNKAAQEMRDRLKTGLVQSEWNRITISTIHALGYFILKEYGHRFGRSAAFNIILPDDDLIKDLFPDPGQVQIVLDQISAWKQSRADQGKSDADWNAICQRYEDTLKANDCFDLDDLIVKPVDLLQNHSEIREKIRQRYAWILVDEFQDINQAQYELICCLTGSSGNLFLIGDPNQAIYGFRGASNQFIERFKKDYPSTTVYPLHISYRCSKPILNASACLITPEQNFTLVSMREGVKVHIVQNATDRSEAEFVARTIESMMGGLRFFSMDSEITQGHEDENFSLSDFAVLVRIGRQLPVIEKAFHDHSIPFQSIGENSLLRQTALRPVIDFLKWSQNPDNPYLTRRLAAVGMTARHEFLSISGSVKEKLLWLKSRFPVAIGNIQPDLWESMVELCESFKDVRDLLRCADLGEPVDLFLHNKEQVALLTLHAAKGLEFQVVFIVGVEEGLLPYAMHGRISDHKEECRLLYVGMTRAKAHLVLSHAGKRTVHGKTSYPERSHFINLIEKEWADYQIQSAGRTHPGKSQLRLFE
jgi:DNA helicase-2/ATP-dependent DNA helicase PcrA